MALSPRGPCALIFAVASFLIGALSPCGAVRNVEVAALQEEGSKGCIGSDCSEESKEAPCACAVCDLPQKFVFVGQEPKTACHYHKGEGWWCEVEDTCTCAKKRKWPVFTSRRWAPCGNGTVHMEWVVKTINNGQPWAKAVCVNLGKMMEARRVYEKYEAKKDAKSPANATHILGRKMKTRLDSVSALVPACKALFSPSNIAKERLEVDQSVLKSVRHSFEEEERKERECGPPWAYTARHKFLDAADVCRKSVDEYYAKSAGKRMSDFIKPGDPCKGLAHPSAEARDRTDSKLLQLCKERMLALAEIKERLDTHKRRLKEARPGAGLKFGAEALEEGSEARKEEIKKYFFRKVMDTGLKRVWQPVPGLLPCANALKASDKEVDRAPCGYVPQTEESEESEE